ncbi:MAG: response regulator [Verrucomicrobia bacterium]|nr:response regulator [Deltaproteobacteria bacterium]
MILIVEDSPTQAEQLRFILEKNHYCVSVARNGKEALAMMNQVQPGLIISDIVMPEMDGYELCRRIKDHDEVCNIRIILLTSLSDPLDVIRGLECGADNFITKPYNEEYLISRIGYLLGNRYEPQDCASLPELKITFEGKEFGITSSRNQILDLLLSTYETAILKNKELIRTRNELNERNEQLKNAVHDLEAFNYTVSHDLRQPLNYIGMASQAIKQLSDDKLDEESKECLNLVVNGVKQMSDLIETLFRFSNSAHSEMHQKMVDLSINARIIAANLKTTEPERQVSFKIAEGLMAYGDSGLLYVVLENLLGNAWKYTGEQRQAVIEFGSVEYNGTTAFFVRDNGPGFDMADAEKIFIPFKRLSGMARFKGHGVGLATVERIIRRHDGKVWAEGQPGSGAVFYFSLNP